MEVDFLIRVPSLSPFGVLIKTNRLITLWSGLLMIRSPRHSGREEGTQGNVSGHVWNASRGLLSVADTT